MGERMLYPFPFLFSSCILLIWKLNLYECFYTKYVHLKQFFV